MNQLNQLTHMHLLASMNADEYKDHNDDSSVGEVVIWWPVINYIGFRRQL